MNSLYYGEAGCHANLPRFSNVGVRFDANVLNLFLRKVYKGFDTSREVEPTMWREIVRVISEGAVEGLSQAAAPPAHDRDFYSCIRHSIEVFAAHKTHTIQTEMAAKLIGSDGKLKPFRQWVQDVAPISSHQVGAWLRTEYDTAVIRAHNAADWREFERNKDIFPNLRWRESTSPNPGADHMPFWGTILPVDHPFWDKHRPGDRWNCKCELESTNEPPTPVPDGDLACNPQRGLENNPGKDGNLFNDTHPYFPSDCSRCFAYKKGGFTNRLKVLFLNREKDCNNCQFINDCLKRQKLTREESTRRLTAAECSEVRESVTHWADTHLDPVVTPSGVEKFIKVTIAENGAELKVNKQTFNETFAKNIHNRRLAETMDLAIHFEEWMPTATLVDPAEPGRHHSCTFSVYRATHNGVTIEFKVKNNENKNVYTMRIK